MTVTLKVLVTKIMKNAGLDTHTWLQLFIDRNLCMLFHLAYRSLTVGNLEGHSDITKLKKNVHLA